MEEWVQVVEKRSFQKEIEVSPKSNLEDQEWNKLNQWSLEEDCKCKEELFRRDRWTQKIRDPTKIA